jgi:hypothetical protein
MIDAACFLLLHPTKATNFEIHAATTVSKTIQTVSGLAHSQHWFASFLEFCMKGANLT